MIFRFYDPHSDKLFAIFNQQIAKIKIANIHARMQHIFKRVKL